MHRHRPLVLLTGFGPFPRVPNNATTLLVPQIAEAAERTFRDARFACHILPTEWGTGLAAVEHLYDRLKPSLALHFGVSGRANGFEIETCGRNLCSMSADAAGSLPLSTALSAAGPEFLPVTLPAAHIVERLRRRGIPAMLSRDAGGYLCNAVFYRTLDLGRRSVEPPRSGFIHLPASLVNERAYCRGPLPRCRMSWDDVVTGGLEIIATCLGRPSPAPLLQRPRVALAGRV